MPGKITKGFRLHNSEQFYEQFDEAAPSNVYFFIARSNPWTDDTAPPAPLDTTSDSTFRIWDNMLSLKRIGPADVSYGVDRVDWKTGTVYDQYTSETEYYEENNFAVLTEEYNVYKCLYNNNGGASTVKPTGKSLTPLTTGDGYVWKYMYTVNASDALKFTSSKIIPVKKLASDDGSEQWDVQAAAVSGEISSILISSGGTGYVENVGTVVLGGTNNIRIATGASGVDNSYNGSSIYISSGTGAGQLRTIVDYDGGDKIVKVDTNFSPAVDTSSTYIVSPRVSITGDGTSATAYSRVESGQVSKIVMTDFGENYNRVSSTVVANNATGAIIVPQVAPVGGHGSDAVTELFAHNVIMNVKMTGSESNNFIVANDFRTVGLIVDPLLNSNNAIATNSAYNQTTRIVVDNPTLTFTADEVVTGSVTGTTAYFVEYYSNNVISVTGNQTAFSTSDTISGATSGAAADVVSITLPSLKRYKGKLLYIENRSPISRAADQQEDVKITVRF